MPSYKVDFTSRIRMPLYKADFTCSKEQVYRRKGGME